jgi:8-oxo-dGTP pyrophosphatase MutT (NUDIX family)
VLYCGGHADGEYDLLSVALREVEEETGLVAEPLNRGEIFSAQCIPVKGHMRKGEYVSSHVHYDIAFLCMVKDDDMNKIRILESENSEVVWLPIQTSKFDGMADWFKPIFQRFQQKIRSVNCEKN